MADATRPLPVILLHSAGRTPQMWQPQVEAIGAEVQLVAPWLAGLRPGKRGELSLPRAATEVLTTMDRFGIASARLVGHQLGAMVALQVAADEPDMVAGLVLSGALTAPSKTTLMMQRAAIRLMPKAALANTGATKADLLKALDVLAEADFGKNLSAITCPVLVVAGASDPVKAAARELAESLPRGDFAEVAGAGGNPSIEAADSYNRLLLEFLGLPG